MTTERFREVETFVLNPSIAAYGEGGAKVDQDKLLIDISPVRGLAVAEAKRLRDWLNRALPDP